VLNKTAKTPSGSNYLIDRLKLTSSNVEKQNSINRCIYIKEHDEALALLLRTTLELQGYDVVDSIDINSSIQPCILIIDSGDNLEDLSFCRELKTKTNFVNSKIIVTTTVHDKAAVLDSGADLYLPKPYEITELIQWIEFLKKQLF
jgi:DNA-binding response OmpR family regulator